MQHGRNERTARSEVRSRVHALEEGLVVDAGVAAILVGILPVGGVIVVIDRALINVIVALEYIIIEGLILVDGSGGDLLSERGLLLWWPLDALSEGTLVLRSSWQRGVIFVGRASEVEDGVLLLMVELNTSAHGVGLFARGVIGGGRL